MFSSRNQSAGCALAWVSYCTNAIGGFSAYGNTFAHDHIVWTAERSVVGARVLVVLKRGLLWQNFNKFEPKC